MRREARLWPGLPDLSAAAKGLDQVYIPSRYPNGIGGEEIIPAEFYGPQEADACLSSSESIIETSRRFLGA